MRSLSACLSLLAIAYGCGGQRGSLPIPSQIPALSSPPIPIPPRVFSEPHTEIPIGQAVIRQVVRAADNPQCVDVPGWYCQYFRLTPTSGGSLTVSVTYSKGSWGLDLSLADPAFHQAWASASKTLPITLRVDDLVKAGTTYEITVWYVTDGIEFELRTALAPAASTLAPDR